MNSIKLDVYPSFMTSCSFRIEATESRRRFIFQKNTFKGIDEDEITLSVDLPDGEETQTVEALASTVVRQAMEDPRIILDGVSLECSVTKNAISCSHKYRCPRPGDPEYFLVAQLANLAQKYFNDPAFVNYMELLEGYFFGNPCPVKLFHEIPFRIRIYGALSRYEKDALEKIILEHAGKDELVIDMSNLQGMGTALHECFLSLKHIPKLSFIANKAAAHHLKLMGFEDELVRFV